MPSCLAPGGLCLSSCLAVREHFLPDRDSIRTAGGESPQGNNTPDETQNGERAPTVWWQSSSSSLRDKLYKHAVTSRQFWSHCGLPAAVFFYFLRGLRVGWIKGSGIFQLSLRYKRWEGFRHMNVNWNILTAFTCGLHAALLINNIQQRWLQIGMQQEACQQELLTPTYFWLRAVHVWAKLVKIGKNLVISVFVFVFSYLRFKFKQNDLE